MGKLNLLPSAAVDFGSEKYWDAFFAKKKEGFEWYGDYEHLAPFLHKCISVKDNILIVGCGNSNLSESLHLAGYTKQRNVDISSVVIKKMRDLVPDLVYEVDDVTNLSSSDEEFSCILDKGTFDALAPPHPRKNRNGDVDEAGVAEAEKSLEMLQEVRRVLKPNGRYICISLLQKHVAEILFGFFNELGWIIQISRCKAAETRSGSIVFPVYVCTFIKLARPVGLGGKSHIVFCGAESKDKGQRMESVEEVIQALRRETGHEVGWKTLGFAAKEEVHQTLSDPTTGQVKYNLYLVDVPEFINKNPVELQFGIFIVPQGRETEYVYGTHEGRLELARQAQRTRLCVVHLLRELQYPPLEEVKTEVGDNIKYLIPDAVREAEIKVQVMTAATDLGRRDVIHQGNSPISGEYVVEDVYVGTNIYRRLVFLGTCSITQSEVPITIVRKQIKAAGKTKTVETKIPVEHELTCDHHGIMAISFPMLKFFMKEDENEARNALLIGLGGGLLVSFLLHYFPKLRITAVELDRAIVEVASSYFGLPPIEENSRLSVVVDDGMKYIRETEDKYNVILFDVDSKSTDSGLSCPPKEFLSDVSLEATKKALSPSGIFALNFVCRSQGLAEEYMRRLSTHFPFIYRLKLTEDLNTVLLCFRESPQGNSKHFLPSLRKSVRYVRDIQVQGGKQRREEEEEPDNLRTLTDDGVQNLCSRFQLLRTKN